jgi:copper chaperone CopZ
MSVHEPGPHGARHNGRAAKATAILHVGDLHYATEKAVVERALANRPGVAHVDANPVAQTATVEYDPGTTSVEALQQWVEECGYHCAGRSVPAHVCDPLADKEPLAPAHDHAAVERADHADGHGHGGHAGMSMAAMVRDRRLGIARPSMRSSEWSRFVCSSETARATCWASASSSREPPEESTAYQSSTSRPRWGVEGQMSFYALTSREPGLKLRASFA